VGTKKKAEKFEAKEGGNSREAMLKAIDEMKAKWPSSVVARSEVGIFTGGMIAPGTMKNLDSQGIGPYGNDKTKHFRGKRVVYPVDLFVEWWKARIG
jgi:hypothetical protein